MTRESEIKAQQESLVTSLISFYNKANESGLDPRDPEIRNKALVAIDEALKSLSEDDVSLKWSEACESMDYDVYLSIKKDDGSLTEYDLIRPGLQASQFCDPYEHSRHMARVENSRKSVPDMKQCRECGTVKLISRFAKAGGAVCNSCRMKAYRERKSGNEN